MSVSPLHQFVHDALRTGQSPETIRAALAKADWTVTEIDAALAAWQVQDGAGVVPRPVRAPTARDALFYALLFICFGMVAGNALALLYGQIDLWMPDPDDTQSYYRLASLRWSMAAIIVFVPAFLLLHRADNRAAANDPARQHGLIRRWLSALALLVAVICLMGDALYLIYTWLDGQLTPRFLVKSATVALFSLLVLAYFRDGRTLLFGRLPLPAAAILTGLSALALGLSLWTIGGPAQGQMEQRDRWRVQDLRRLTADMRDCSALDHTPLPESFDPMACAQNRDRLTGYAAEIRYERVDSSHYKLCIPVEFQPAVRPYAVEITGNLVCSRLSIE